MLDTNFQHKNKNMLKINPKIKRNSNEKNYYNWYVTDANIKWLWQ